MLSNGKPGQGGRFPLVHYEVDEDELFGPASPTTPGDGGVEGDVGGAVAAIPLPGEGQVVVEDVGDAVLGQPGVTGGQLNAIFIKFPSILLHILIFLYPEVLLPGTEPVGGVSAEVVEELDSMSAEIVGGEERSDNVVEERGEREKASRPLDDGAGADSRFGEEDSSMEAMSVSTSMSIPSLESVTHDLSGNGAFTLQNPALTRLVAEAFRIGREGVIGSEHSILPAKSLLLSIANGLGSAGGAYATPILGGASANPSVFATPTPPGSHSTPVSGGGSGGGEAASPLDSCTTSTPVSGVAGDTISTSVYSK